MITGLGTYIIVGLPMALLLSVLITEAYAQTPTANNTNTTTTAPLIANNSNTGSSTTSSTSVMNETAYYAKQAETKALFNATLQAQLTNPQIQALKAQDPEFNNFGNIVADCTDIADGYNNLPANQCNLSIQRALDQWCLLDDDYHAEKCSYVQGVQQNYTRALELSYELFLFQQQQERGGAALAP